MKFDELRVLWNTGADEPLFVIDRQAMHTLVRNKSQKIERDAEFFELAVIAVTLMTAIILSLDAWRDGDSWHPYAISMLCVIVGIATLRTRKRRKNAEVVFDQSILRIAQGSLDRIETHIRLLKRLFWCFHLPVAITAAIGLTLYRNNQTPMIWLGVLLVTGISYAGTVYDIEKKLIPQQRDVKDLLAKLTEAGEEA